MFPLSLPALIKGFGTGKTLLQQESILLERLSLLMFIQENMIFCKTERYGEQVRGWLAPEVIWKPLECQKKFGCADATVQTRVQADQEADH